MKTGHEKRHAARIQLALDLCLEISQKMHERQEAQMNGENVNPWLGNVETALEHVVNAANFCGINDACERMEKVNNIGR